MVLNVIGTSKVAFLITKILLEKGYTAGYVISRKRERAESFCQALGQGMPVEYDQDYVLSGIIFLSTPDDMLEYIYDKIRTRITNGTLIHFSGFKSSQVFYDADERDLGRASLHPNLSFADLSVAESMIRSCCFGIEGNQRGISDAEKIAKQISNCYVTIPTESKPAYHLAAVVASNFLVGLAHLSKSIYEKNQIDGFEKIIPTLMLNTVKNICNLGVLESLTGPVARGDWKVVEAEREVFSRVFPKLANLYDLMVDLLKDLKGRRENVEHTKADGNEG